MSKRTQLVDSAAEPRDGPNITLIEDIFEY